MFVFQSTIDNVDVYQMQLNCPYPVNAGIVTLDTIDPPFINYTIEYIETDGNYTVSVFHCSADIVTGNPTVEVETFTSTSTEWFALTDKVTGYMFYLSQSASAFFLKIVAGANLIWIMLFPVAQVSGLAFFGYVQAFLYALVGLGTFMVIRGS